MYEHIPNIIKNEVLPSPLILIGGWPQHTQAQFESTRRALGRIQWPLTSGCSCVSDTPAGPGPQQCGRSSSPGGCGGSPRLAECSPPSGVGSRKKGGAWGRTAGTSSGRPPPLAPGTAWWGGINTLTVFIWLIDAVFPSQEVSDEL